MKTKPTLLLSMIVLAALPLALPLTMDAQDRRRGRSTSTNVDGDRPISSCGDIRVTYDRRPAITEETQTTLPSSQVSTLRAQTSNSGIYVTGWDRMDYSVTTCKAIPDDDPDPTDTLREITTTTTNGRIAVSGPTGREWMANLIIRVPRLSSLDLQTANGPLQLRDLAGAIQVNAANGPISLDNVGGSVQATTANGPISLKGASGDHRLTASNGPVSVALTGTRWEGPGLEVTTRNGPLSISVPNVYASGIRIQTSDRSPVNCSAPACAGATRSLSSPGIIQIGNGVPIVRLSSVNGPLSIQAARN